MATPKKRSAKQQSTEPSSLHRALKESLSDLPRTLMRSLLVEKLQAQGLDEADDLVDALTDHALNGGEDQFVWDDGREDRRKFTLSFTDEDAKKLADMHTAILDGLPAMVDEITDGSALSMLRSLKRDWPHQSLWEQAQLNGFRQNLDELWGDGLDRLKMFLTICREIGEDHYHRLRRSRSAKNRVLRSVLARLHARSCQVAAEIINLMEGGFADGAMARWRTLYEIGVVAEVLCEGGEVLAVRYVEHSAIESKSQLDEYDKVHVALGFRPIPKRDRQAVDRSYKKALAKHGNDFAKSYGWAVQHLKRKKVTFRDLEVAARRAQMRPFYKMASYNIHADIKGLTHRLGVGDDSDVILAGASNAGLVEPGQNCAISLVQITSLLLLRRSHTIDSTTQLKLLVLLRDEIVNTVVRSDRQLKRNIKAEEQDKTTRGRRRSGR